MKNLSPCVLLSLLFGCGSSTAPSQQTLNLAVSGTVQPLMLPATATPPSMTQLTVNIGDSGAFISTPTAPPLATTPLTTQNGACPGGCAFSVAAVNVDLIPYQVASQVNDGRPAGSTLWVSTLTSLTRVDQTTTHRDDKTPFTGMTAFVIPSTTVATLSQATGVSDANLLMQGYMVGLALGNPNEASTIYPGLPPPVKGVVATLTSAAGFQPNAATIYYPNDTYTASNSTAGTNADGVFIIVGPANPLTLNVAAATLNSNDAIHTWDPNYQIGTAPYVNVLVPFIAGP